VCVCILTHPACNTQAPYCHLWPVRLYSISPHFLINGTILKKKGFEHKMCVLIFSAFFFFISHSTKISARYYHKYFHIKYSLFWSGFNGNWTFSTDFRYVLKHNLKKTRPVEAELFHADWQADGHDDANSRCSHFCEGAWKASVILKLFNFT
jgi:hypothetical protein